VAQARSGDFGIILVNSMYHCVNTMPAMTKALQRRRLKLKNVEVARTPESLSDVEMEMVESCEWNSSDVWDCSSHASTSSSNGQGKEENRITAEHAGSLKSEIDLMRSKNEWLELANKNARLAIEQAKLQWNYQDMMSILNKPSQGPSQNYNSQRPCAWYHGMGENTSLTAAPVVYCLAVPMAEHPCAASASPASIDNNGRQAGCSEQQRQQQQQQGSQRRQGQFEHNEEQRQRRRQQQPQRQHSPRQGHTQQALQGANQSVSQTSPRFALNCEDSCESLASPDDIAGPEDSSQGIVISTNVPCTTVMIRNMPNNYTRAMMLAMIDCKGFRGQYDFVYMPVDFATKVALGYAFINFHKPEQAELFWKTFDGFTDWMIPSRKICTISWGNPHQGLWPNIERYRNSPVMHEQVPDLYKPVLFMDGVRVPFPEPTKKLRSPRIRRRN